MSSTDLSTGHDERLLFEPPLRWGFEYVEPAPPTLSPERIAPPQARAVRMVSGVRKAAVVATVGAVLMIILDSSLGAVTIASAGGAAKSIAVVIVNLVGAAITFYVTGVVVGSQSPFEPRPHTMLWRIARTIAALFIPWLVLGVLAIVAWRRISRSTLVPDPADQKRVEAEYQAAVEAWQRRIAQYEEVERRRHEAADRWFPVGPPQTSRTVTVFGGSHITWAASLCTLGASLIGTGARLLVLDLSRRWTTAPFFDLCTQSEVPTRALVLPRDASQAGLFDGLTWNDLSTIIVEVVHSEIQDPDTARREKQGDRSVIREVADCLDPDGEVSLRKLRHALLVIQGSQSSSADGLVSGKEFDALAGLYNEVQRQHGGVMERVTRLQRDLREFESLAASPSPDGSPARAPAPGTGSGAQRRQGSLTVLEVDKRTDDLDNERLVGLLSQLLLRQVRNRLLQAEVVVILGADSIRRRLLESLVTQAGQQGTGVILFFEHLRGEAIELIGGGGASAVFGRLSNHREAQEATEFIGSDYKWVESSLTVSQGASITETWGDEQGQGYQETHSFPMGSSHGTSSTSSHSYGRSLGKTFESAVGEQRVYERVVEPSVLQGLANTQIICVQVMPGGARVAKTVDCYPPRRFDQKVSLTALELPAG